MDQFSPATAWNMVHVLEHFGVKVHYNQAQTCCGFAAFTAGQKALADKLTEKYVDEFSGLRAVICPDQSCTRMVREYMHPDAGNLTLGNKLKALNKIYRTFTEYLLEIPEESFTKLQFKEKVTCLPACQCGNQELTGSKTVQLMKRIKGLKVMKMEQIPACCGFGGTFQLSHADLSKELASEVFREVINAGADYLICDDTGCQMHLAAYAREYEVPVIVWHIVDLLAEVIKKV